MSLVWVVVLTTLLVTTVSLVFGYQNIKFLGGLRKFGRSLKALVLLFSVTLGSFLLLPLVYPRQVSWEMRKIDGVAVLSGPVSGIVFAALCCFIAMTFCASFICSWDL
ncbi:hypothetical protein DL95DRAFT_396866 [Leptodontidium sp. 2 PMI_412]|nr:hypothetical protein DL95DRAFT_396866 [Leptodontidium sp. 2 PMI_412]